MRLTRQTCRPKTEVFDGLVGGAGQGSGQDEDTDRQAAAVGGRVDGRADVGGQGVASHTSESGRRIRRVLVLQVHRIAPFVL